MQKPIYLIGFMGSGKTTLGKKLAQTLTVPFVDLDQEIVKKIGMTIPAYFDIYGEEEFRKIEKEVLSSTAGLTGIVSTGGGTPCFFNNMEWLLCHGLVVYLKHSPKSLWNRLNQSDVAKRPALKGMTGEELLTFIEDKLAARAIYYNQAHLQVDQINIGIEEMVSIIQQHQLTVDEN